METTGVMEMLGRGHGSSGTGYYRIIVLQSPSATKKRTKKKGKNGWFQNRG